jgi:membrane protein
MVVAVIIGISRAIFGDSKKRGLAQRNAVETDGSTARGRPADKPAEIPPKGWMDIAWRVYDDIQNDRVLLIAAGVTFYGLLAVFPATAAVVSLYGLFADASSINEHMQFISGFLPQGALQVISDQVKRIASHGSGTLGFAFLGSVVSSL